mgnify:CR=1 FL=1
MVIWMLLVYHRHQPQEEEQIRTHFLKVCSRLQIQQRRIQGVSPGSNGPDEAVELAPIDLVADLVVVTRLSASMRPVLYDEATGVLAH